MLSVVVFVSCVVYQTTLLSITYVKKLLSNIDESQMDDVSWYIMNIFSLVGDPLYNCTSEEDDSTTDVLILLAVAEQRKQRQLAKENQQRWK
jgi:hypothetical protein